MYTSYLSYRIKESINLVETDEETSFLPHINGYLIVNTKDFNSILEAKRHLISRVYYLQEKGYTVSRYMIVGTGIDSLRLDELSLLRGF